MKLPVMPAIGGTLTISRKNWLTLLQISWLPIILGYGATIGATMAIVGANSSAVMLSPLAMLPLIMGLMLVWMGVYAMVFAGILRLVLNGDKPGLPFYLRFAAEEFRIFITWLLYAFIVVGLYFGFAIVFGIVTFVGASAAQGNPAIMGGVFVVGLILCLAGFWWFNLRLSLATPAAVGAETIGIGPSWGKTKGNVWRLLGFWLLLILLGLGFNLTITSVLYPDYLPALLAFLTSIPRGDGYATQAAFQTMLMTTSPVPDFSLIFFVRLVVGVIAGFIAIAVFAVAGGVAWRYLTEEDRPEKHFE